LKSRHERNDGATVKKTFRREAFTPNNVMKVYNQRKLGNEKKMLSKIVQSKFILIFQDIKSYKERGDL
jgi:hypothetical protein